MEAHVGRKGSHLGQSSQNQQYFCSPAEKMATAKHEALFELAELRQNLDELNADLLRRGIIKRMITTSEVSE
jgi:hypothetical protein